MDSYSGSELCKFTSFHLDKKKLANRHKSLKVLNLQLSHFKPVLSGQKRLFLLTQKDPQQTVPMDQGTPQLECSPSQSLLSQFFGTDSSGSIESCGTYITYKMSQMEEAAAKDFAEVTEMA